MKRNLYIKHEDFEFRVWHNNECRFLTRDSVRTPNKVTVIGHAASFSLIQKVVTIQQFTGLKDRGNKKMFVGDITEAGGKRKHRYVIINTKSGYKLRSITNPKTLIALWKNFFMQKVIGNVFENAELLNPAE